MQTAQAPVTTPDYSQLEGLEHLNCLIKGTDRDCFSPAGGVGVFQFFTEEEGNQRPHVVEISAKHASQAAPWHNGHVAVLTLDGEPISRKDLRSMLV